MIRGKSQPRHPAASDTTPAQSDDGSHPMPAHGRSMIEVFRILGLQPTPPPHREVHGRPPQTAVRGGLAASVSAPGYGRGEDRDEHTSRGEQAEAVDPR